MVGLRMRSSALHLGLVGFSLTAFTALTAAGCSAPSHACTEIGCVNGLTLSFQKASSTWEPGMYSIVIDADGKKITCTTKLPLSATDPAPSSCTDASVQLGVSGSALPAAQHGLVGLDFTSTPAKVTVTVTRDNAMIGTKDFSPTYKKSQPNGPDCEPVCNNASDTLPIS
jgi:hypothetical protein